MGKVLPRENSWVEAVPCRILTQSSGSRRDVAGGLGGFGLCSASVNTVLTAARPDVLRNVRLLGPFSLPIDMLSSGAFPKGNLYQDRLLGVHEHPHFQFDCAMAKNAVPSRTMDVVGEINGAIIVPRAISRLWGCLMREC